VKQLASLLDDLDASAKSSRIRTADLVHHSRSAESSPPDSPRGRYENQQRSTVAGHQKRSVIVDDGTEHDGYSDLDEMLHNVPSDEEPDPNMSPPHSTPMIRGSERSKHISRAIFNDETSPVRGLKSAQKPPSSKTPAKTVDFKDVSVYPPSKLLMCRSLQSLDNR
jgi:hypothetical protein